MRHSEACATSVCRVLWNGIEDAIQQAWQTVVAMGVQNPKITQFAASFFLPFRFCCR
jgi:hypothetical protein